MSISSRLFPLVSGISLNEGEQLARIHKGVQESHIVQNMSMGPRSIAAYIMKVFHPKLLMRTGVILVTVKFQSH